MNCEDSKLNSKIKLANFYEIDQDLKIATNFSSISQALISTQG